MERYNVHDEYMTPSEAGNVVLHADAQRALDAEREKVAFLEKKNANLIEASNLVLKVKAEQDAQLATLQAQLAGLKRNAGLDCGDQSCLYAVEHTGMRTNGGCRCDPKRMKDDLVRSRKACDALQAQLADRDAMILQMGEQAAVLAKENMAVKAQLRQVEGERDHAKKMEAVQKEVADNQTWHVQKLKDWRDTVTLALQRPGGARFEDVPGHIKTLVREREAHAQDVDELIDCCINDVLVTHATPGGKPHDPDPQIRPLRDKIAGSLVELQALRQLVEALPVVDGLEVSVWLSPDESGWLVSKRPAFQAGLYWAKFRSQAEADSFRALFAYRATLAAQDAGVKHGM